jgi:hypothetical protein
VDPDAGTAQPGYRLVMHNVTRVCNYFVTAECIQQQSEDMCTAQLINKLLTPEQAADTSWQPQTIAGVVVGGAHHDPQTSASSCPAESCRILACAAGKSLAANGQPQQQRRLCPTKFAAAAHHDITSGCVFACRDSWVLGRVLFSWRSAVEAPALVGQWQWWC